MIPGISIRGVIGALTLSILLFVPAVLWLYDVPTPGGHRQVPQPPSIASIRDMSDLLLKSIHINDELPGSNRHYEGRWLLHGELMVAMDLSKVAYVRTDPEKRTATLLLPMPYMLEPRVDHERSKELYMKKLSVFATSDPQILRNEVWRVAQVKLTELGQDPRYRAEAKGQAEKVLRNLFDAAGWKVGFEWKDDTPAMTADASR
jgi:Protein of unknown function (DUF4230)